MKVLILEDEIELSNYLEEVFLSENFEVRCIKSPQEAIREHAYLECDVIILDLMLGEEDGATFLKYLRENEIFTPVIVLSAVSQISEKISLINIGADDFINKPFNKEELMARIFAILRRSKPKSGEEKIGNLSVNWESGETFIKNREIKLTKTERKVLFELIKGKNTPIKTETLLMKVWGGRIGSHSNVVQSTIRRLRKKLGTFGEKITNIHGIGYKIKI